MLQQLTINNFALIENIKINPREGLNLLTGETGAGKTIVAGALSVLMGSRASSGYIRKGEQEAAVEGFFEVADRKKVAMLESWGIEEPGEGLLLRREISRKGRNRCLINGSMVPLNLYRQAGSALIDIHGQNQEQSLLKEDRQLDLLDRYGGFSISQLKEKVRGTWEERKKAKEEYEKLCRDLEETRNEEDFLTYQWEEIDKYGLETGEKEELEKERTKLENLENLYSGTHNIYSLLSDEGAVLEKLGEAIEQAQKVQNYDDALDEWFRYMNDAYYSLEEAAREIRSYQSGLDFESGRLDAIEQRLADIHFLEKKYGGSVEAVLQYQEEAAQRLALLENRDQEIAHWEKVLNEKNSEYEAAAAELTEEREKAASALKDKMNHIVRQLSLPHAELDIDIQTGKPGPEGKDRARFMFCPNPGEGYSSLAGIASGGEISRVMLAVKVILADVDDINILVFDEVDTGIGGEAIVSVAENLSRLASKKQVFCVSHAPQLAAYGDNHFRIEKQFDGNRTTTGIKQLDKEERILEISRMLGGEDNIEGVRDQAEKMLKSARDRKEKLF